LQSIPELQSAPPPATWNHPDAFNGQPAPTVTRPHGHAILNKITGSLDPVEPAGKQLQSPAVPEVDT